MPTAQYPTRRWVPTSVYHTLVVALVLSRLDYGNAVLVGLPAYLYNRLQLVLNAAARSIAGLRRSDHITDTHSPVSTGRRSRNVFSSSWRQSFIVQWMVRLLATWLQICAVCLTCRPDDVWDRHSLTSSMSASRSVQLLETELSLWLLLDYGTVCHITSSRVTHCHSFVLDSKHFYSDSHILLFCFSSLPCGPRGFYLGHVKISM